MDFFNQIPARKDIMLTQSEWQPIEDQCAEEEQAVSKMGRKARNFFFD